MPTNKNWWAPVWRGLVVDPEGKHHRKMKSAVWLFLYFLLHADRRTGRLKRKFKTTASDMGVPQKTIQRWLNVLKDEGYVDTKNNGRCLEIGIKLWKNANGNSAMATQSVQRRPFRKDIAEESHSYPNAQKSL